jgi:hypothetical protein
MTKIYRRYFVYESEYSYHTRKQEYILKDIHIPKVFCIWVWIFVCHSKARTYYEGRTYNEDIFYMSLNLPILPRSKNIFWRTNIYRKYFVYKSESSCLTSKQVHILKDEYIPKVFGIWVWIFVSHQETKTYSERRTYTEDILYMSLNLCISPGSKNMFWRTNKYRRYFVYESESSYLTRRQEHILKDEHIPKIFCIWVWIFVSHQEARTYSEGRTYTEGILYMSLKLCISPRSKNMFTRTNIYRRYFVYESEFLYLTKKQEHILKDEDIPKVFCIWDWIFVSHQEARTYSEGPTYTEGILYMSLNLCISPRSKNISWRTNIYRRYFVYESESLYHTKKQEHIPKDEHIAKVFSIWVWIFLSHQEARTYSEGQTYTEGILYMSLNLCISPRSKNIFWKTNIYRRYFVYESESLYLTKKQEHILKEKHIPKVFCICVWIFISHQEASSYSEGRINTEGILCMSLNLCVLPGSKNIFWRTNIYRRYFVYESQYSYLNRKQEHILKDVHTPKLFCIWVWIFVSHQEARTYSEGRTYTEGILYMSLNLCISPGSKNIFWRTNIYRRDFVYESESLYLARKQEHILKDKQIPKLFCVWVWIFLSYQEARTYSEGRTYTEGILYKSLNLRIPPGNKNILKDEHIPKVFCIWVWIFVSHQEAKTYSEGRTYTEDILCMSLNIRFSPGSKNIFWRTNIYRRYFVYESESLYLTKKQERILKDVHIPEVFCIWVWIFVSYQEARTYSDGRTYNEGTLYTSLNLCISPGVKNIFWRKNILRMYSAYESESSFLTRNQEHILKDDHIPKVFCVWVWIFVFHQEARNYSEGRTYTEGILYTSLNLCISTGFKNIFWRKNLLRMYFVYESESSCLTRNQKHILKDEHIPKVFCVLIWIFVSHQETKAYSEGRTYTEDILYMSLNLRI